MEVHYIICINLPTMSSLKTVIYYLKVGNILFLISSFASLFFEHLELYTLVSCTYTIVSFKRSSIHSQRALTGSFAVNDRSFPLDFFE